MENIWNNINHLFYTKHDKHNNLLAMLSITVDDLSFLYKDETVETEFYNNLSDAFNITTPPNRIWFKFLSLTIQQSEHSTSFDKTQHTQDKILHLWFDIGQHHPKCIGMMITVDVSHELDCMNCSITSLENYYTYNNGLNQT